MPTHIAAIFGREITTPGAGSHTPYLLFQITDAGREIPTRRLPIRCRFAKSRGEAPFGERTQLN
jgi:hypothetical protein